jgi:hypothetical protein
MRTLVQMVLDNPERQKLHAVLRMLPKHQVIRRLMVVHHSQAEQQMRTMLVIQIHHLSHMRIAHTQFLNTTSHVSNKHNTITEHSTTFLFLDSGIDNIIPIFTVESYPASEVLRLVVHV